MNYSELRTKMKTGDLISWEGRGIVSGIIRRKTNSPITHSSIVFCSADNRIMIAESTGKDDVHLCFLSDKLRDYKGTGYWSHLRTTKRHRDEIYKPILTLMASGVDYDTKDLFRQLWGRVDMDTERLFCSEFVFHCWVKANVMPAQKIAPTPGELPLMYCCDQMIEIEF